MLWKPSAAWVELIFSNGYYPAWEHFWSSWTPAVPFAIGDVVIWGGVLWVLGVLAFGFARARKARSVAFAARAVFGAAAIAGVYGAWFYAGWGWGYDRAPVTDRVAFEAARVNPAAIDRLRARAIDRMNRLAPLAHARSTTVFDEDRLAQSWLPVVQRLGDRWTPHVFPAKPAAAGFIMDKNGTSGFTNPFTLETQLAPDLLWFERPFSQAHEWSHAAGFNREDEANFIAVLSCLRDADPVAQYSGWLELFLYLPPLPHYARTAFVPQVWADFAALRARNAHFINLNFSRFSWRVYNRYLTSNRIASGVQNYNEVTRLVAGIPLDGQGLPMARDTSP